MRRAARRWSSTRSRVSDGVSMGTEGMKASLVSREVIADSIELVVRGHLFDGVVCLVGCDKTIPAAAMALGRLDVPGLDPLQRHDLPGRLQGPAERHRGHGVRGHRRLSGRQDQPRRAVRGRERRLSRGGRVWRPVHRQHDGDGHGVHRLSPAGLNGIPAEDPAKDEAARQSGELVMDLVRRDVRPSAFVTRAVARERHRLHRGDRRFDQRRPPPPGHRARVRHPARHRRVRSDRRPDPDRRRHATGRPLHGDRHVRGGRRRSGHARAAEAPGPARRRRADRRRPDDRGDRGWRASRPRADGSSSRSRRRSSRPAAWRSCAGRSPRTAASSSSPATSAGSTAARPACSTPRAACFEAVKERRIVAGDVVVIR